MLMATDYLRPVGRGVTSPQLFRADDGMVYVVKLRNNRLGPKILANELLAACFGQLLGLCFPPSCVIQLDEQVLNQSRHLLKARVGTGLHFACKYLNDACYLSPSNLIKAVNKEEMAGVILFDHLFHNPDRTLNRRNLLLRKEPEGPRIYAIDNSHLFQRGAWTKKTLEDLAGKVKINRYRCYGILLRHFLTPDCFDGYLAKLRQISDRTVAKIIEGIPLEWLPQASDRQALEEYSIFRCHKAAHIAAHLSALIPTKNRVTI